MTLGLAASFALGRFLESLLYQIEPTHGGVLIAVGLLLGLVSLLASLVPAVRAARVDPMIALAEG